TGRKEKGDPLNSAIDKMTKKTRDLRRQRTLNERTEVPLDFIQSSKYSSEIISVLMNSNSDFYGYGLEYTSFSKELITLELASCPRKSKTIHKPSVRCGR
ncbi:Catenin alpha-2, partial [Larimichthys crocea]